jgi:hypothetical protein
MNRHLAASRRALVLLLLAAPPLLGSAAAGASLPGMNGDILVIGPAGLTFYEPGGGVDRTVTLPGAEPALSPDGSKIAFTQNFRIWVMNSDGSAPHAVGPTSLTSQSLPAWSPSGGKIAFGAQGPNGHQVYTMGAGGGAVTQLTQCASPCGAPAWSPNGARIAYALDGGPASHIHVINNDGTNDLDLNPNVAIGGLTLPDWSPNGSQIAAMSSVFPSAGIWVMNSDGTNPVLIPNTERSGPPIWSPDGAMIAYATFDTHELVTILRDGSGKTVVGPASSSDRAGWQALQSRLSLTVSAASVTMPHTVTLSGALDVLNATGAGRTVHVTGTPPGGTPTALGDVTTDANGAYTFDYLPIGAGTWQFSAQWAGDPSHAGSTRTTTVKVSARSPGLTIRLNRSRIAYGTSTTLTAHLGASHTNRDVSIFRTPAGGTKTPLMTATVDAAGNVSIDVSPTRNTVYTVEYAGDDYDSAASASATLSVLVVLDNSMSRYARRSRDHYDFRYSANCAKHGIGCPVFTVRVTPPLPGQEVSVQLDRLVKSGSYGYVDTFYTRLGRRSSASVIFRYFGPGIKKYRFALSSSCSPRYQAGVTSSRFYIRII